MGTEKFTKRVTVRKWVGHPKKEGVVEIEIDVERLAAKLAERAFWNSSRKSALAGGAIKAKVHSVAEVSP